MDECCLDVARVLGECEACRIDSLAEVDRIVVLVKSVTERLNLLTSQISQEDGAFLTRLVTILNQLCIEYETRLEYLGQSSTAGRGRPRKLINISLVST